MSKPVSIIIIAHNNHEPLQRALKAIDTHARSIDQKIIILNNPSKQVLEISKGLNSNWELVTETKPGPQHARNAGAKKAQHEYFLFLDDDTELTAGAIESLLGKFTDPHIALAQAYISLEKGNHFFWNYLRYRQINLFKSFQKKTYQSCDTAGILVKKDWFNAVKGFSEDLRFGEDQYFAIKLLTNKARIVYDFKVPLVQIYDPTETFGRFLEKVKRSTPYTILLRKKMGQPNYINFSFPTFKIFNLTKMLFVIIDLFILVYLEVLLGPYRNELAPLQEVRFKKLRGNVDKS